MKRKFAIIDEVDMNFKKLMYIQPVIASYRMPYFLQVANQFKTTYWAGCGAKKGFLDNYQSLRVKNAPIIEFFDGKICFQKNILSGFFSSKPNLVFMNANPRNISMWLLLVFAKMKGVKFLLHGQGLYHKPNPAYITRLMYRLLIMLSYQYVCYTKYSFESLKFLPKSIQKKLIVAENTLINETEVPPFEKNQVARDILFIGRLREMVNLEALIEAVGIVNEKLHVPVRLHVVGGGQDEGRYRSCYASRQDVIFYGAIFDDHVIADISKKCLVGCYPGAAGLSVVHYMSLSLIPLVNRDMTSHMGPEPSYIVDGFNGVFFDMPTPSSIGDALIHILSTDYPDEMIVNAYKTYINLNNPSYGDKLVSIIQDAHLNRN